MERYREAAARVLSSRFLPFVLLLQRRQAAMNLFELTRSLVDIESTTNHEGKVGDYLFANLSALAARHNDQTEQIPVEPNRDNVFACWGEPFVTFSTHMDTVPAFFASREDDEFIWGRGSCDAKGVIADMIADAEQFLYAGTRTVAR